MQSLGKHKLSNPSSTPKPSKKQRISSNKMAEQKDNDVQMFDYVIVGGGNAAGYAIKEFVDSSKSTSEKLCMISSEGVLPYERPALSKGYLLKPKLELPMFNTCAFEKQSNDIKYYQDNNITVHLSTTVTKIDYQNKVIETNKNTSIKYGKLMLATGCSAARFSDFLPSDKCTFKNIHYLRDIEDARSLKALLFDKASKDKECVVIGGGYIGMELTSVLITTGAFKKVTMVFPEQHMMATRGLFTKEIAQKYHDLYEQNGVEFVCNSSDLLVESFSGDDDGNVSTVNLKNGKKISAQVVIVGIGGRANIGLCKDELEIDVVTKGLKVDKYLQSVTNSDVYGVGDIASFECGYLKNQRVRLEHVRHARASAKYAMKAMMDTLNENEKKNGYDFLPFFYSRVFGQNWQFYGDTSSNAEIKVWGKDIDGKDFVKDRKFKLCAMWIEKESEKIVGVLVDSDDENERKIAESMVRNGKNIKDAAGLIKGFVYKN